MPPSQPLSQAIEVCDQSPTELARRVGRGVVRQNVEYWLRTGRVPVDYCTDVERASNGLVRRWDLRPHDWHLIWPELIGAEGAPGVPSSTAEAQRAA